MTARPTRRGWGVLVLAATVAVAWRPLRLRELLLLAVLCAAAVVCSLVGVAVAAGLARLDVRASTPVATPSVSDTVDVTARLRHRLPVALAATVHWRWARGSGPTGTRVPLLRRLSAPGAPASGLSAASDMDEGDSPVHQVVIPAGRGAATTMTITLRHRGRQAIGIAEVALVDPLGLASASVRTQPAWTVHVLVLPRLLAPGELPRAVGGNGEEGATPGPGEPAGNLRDYRQGDALRLIHWKQSARQDRLLVNVPESGSGVTRAVALITDQAAYGGRAGTFGTTDLPGSEVRAGRAFELAVSVTATLAMEWLRRGDRVLIGTGSQGVASLPVRGADHLLRTLAGVQPGAGGTSQAGEQSTADVIVTGSVTERLRRALGVGGGRGTVLLTRPDAPGLSAGGEDTAGARGGGAGPLPPGWVPMAVRAQQRAPDHAPTTLDRRRAGDRPRGVPDVAR